jgi:hypothetical protein
MNPFWSQIACELSPDVYGKQPRTANLVKLNTNESPFGPSPLALEAMRDAATDALRLYPDPEATELPTNTCSGFTRRCCFQTDICQVDHLGADGPEPTNRAGFVRADQSGIPGDIGG